MSNTKSNLFESEVAKMKRLMSYGKVQENSKPVAHSNIEVYKEGADGKIYGVIKENSKYYIKVANKNDKLVAEDFNYIGGEVNKNDYLYESYNVASKQLDLKLISINEAKGVNDYNGLAVSGVDKQQIMTENAIEMKESIERFKQLMYNSNNINTYITEDKSFTPNHPGVPEAPKTADEPKKEGDPFVEKPEFVDKEVTDTQKPNMAESVTGREQTIQKTDSDATKKGKPFDDGVEHNEKEVKAQNKTNIKDVKENYETNDWGMATTKEDPENLSAPFEDKPKNINESEEEPKGTNDWGMPTTKEDPTKLGDPFVEKPKDCPEGKKDVVNEMTLEDVTIDADDEEIPTPEFGIGDEDGLGVDEPSADVSIGVEAEPIGGEGDMSQLLQTVLDKIDALTDALGAEDMNMDGEQPMSADVSVETDPIGDTDVTVQEDADDDDFYNDRPENERMVQSQMQGADGRIYSFNDIVLVNGDSQQWEVVGFKNGSLELMPPTGEDKEIIATPGRDSINIIQYANPSARKYNSQIGENKLPKSKYLEGTRLVGTQIINEDGTVLHDFGNHPGYRKKVMTLPTDKHTEKDGYNVWDDEEGLGEKPFGQKIGDGAPFDKPVSKLIADSVVNEMRKQGLDLNNAELVAEAVTQECLRIGLFVPKKKI